MPQIRTRKMVVKGALELLANEQSVVKCVPAIRLGECRLLIFADVDRCVAEGKHVITLAVQNILGSANVPLFSQLFQGTVNCLSDNGNVAVLNLYAMIKLFAVSHGCP